MYMRDRVAVHISAKYVQDIGRLVKSIQVC
jgi:hypothetical protein